MPSASAPALRSAAEEEAMAAEKDEDDVRQAQAAPEATQAFAWPHGRACALSLTFDDARASQLAVGLPILRAHGVRASFFAR